MTSSLAPELLEAFLLRCKGRRQRISELFESGLAQQGPVSKRQPLIAELHSLAGEAGVCGFIAASNLARDAMSFALSEGGLATLPHGCIERVLELAEASARGDDDKKNQLVRVVRSELKELGARLRTSSVPPKA